MSHHLKHIRRPAAAIPSMHASVRTASMPPYPIIDQKIARIVAECDNTHFASRPYPLSRCHKFNSRGAGSMDNVSVGRDVRLSYWQGSLDGPGRGAQGPRDVFLDHPAPDDDDAGWPDPVPRNADHAVIAVHRRSGRSLGLLTAQVHVAGDETFMHLSVAGLQPGSQGSVLLRRMVALLLLRLVGLEKLPDAIVLDWWDGDLGPVLRELAVKCAGARVYPEADTTVVSLPTAALSHRVARFLGQPRARTPNGAGGALLVVDLRHVAEETLVEHARSLHRVRLSRKGIVPPVMPLILADYRRGVAQRP